MSPRTGRPMKGDKKRDKPLQLSVTEDELKAIQLCADELGVSRTDAIVHAINTLLAEIKKK